MMNKKLLTIVMISVCAIFLGTTKSTAALKENVLMTNCPTDYVDQNVSICDGDTYMLPSGTLVSTAGTYPVTLTNMNGCDSIVTTYLTVNLPTVSYTDVTECNSYNWNGNIYTVTGSYNYVTANAVGCDSTAYLTLVINYSTTSTSNETACDVYEWNGNAYTTSGTYTYTTSNSVGCDSIATLNLVVNYSTSSISNETACDSYTWNGNTYTTSGSYSYSTTNAVGCDSTAYLTLVINNSTSSTSNETACDEYDWNGNTYYLSGTYTYTTTNAVGCDSTATLNLVVNYSNTSNTNYTACDAYEWNGNTYTTSGTYTYTTSNVAGCDSVATLDLIVNYSTSSISNETVCDSYDWNGDTYSTSGTYTYTTTNSLGCDSVATLNLVVNYSYIDYQSAAICDGDSILLGGAYQYADGDYTDVFTGANGCDSIIVTTLTVNSLPNTDFFSTSTICENQPTINLNNLLIPFVTATGGTWSGSGVSGTDFSAAGLGGQTASVTYTVTDGNSCTGSTTKNVAVQATPNVDWTSPGTVCTNAGNIDLTSLLDVNAVTGGTWSGIDVMGNNFNPLLSGGQTITVTYTVTTGVCTNSQSHPIAVNPSTNALWFSVGTVCDNDTINLDGLVIGTSGGTWTGQGVDANWFIAAGLGGQSIPVTYTVSSGGCVDSLVDTIVVNTTPIASIVAPEKICDGEVLNLNEFITGTVGGSWSGDDVIDSLLIGNVNNGPTTTVIYNVANGSCQSSDTAVIDVYATPVAILDLSNINTLCNTGTSPVVITGAVPAGGVFSGTVVVGNTIDPTLATSAGFYVIEYAYTNQGGCTGLAYDSVYIDVCTGIASKSTAKQVIMYPNPTNGLVQLANVPTGSMVTVYNVLGEVVITTELFNSTATVDLTGYTNGIYYVRINNNNTVIFDQKVVKN